ncbi:MAG: RNA 3'-terminal phosphate cyclase [Thermoanaerobaculaceae bacterium]
MGSREQIHIDGSRGEGGGQILRSALALSLVTARPFEISGIRARRPKPGLLRQHLAAVEAARVIGQGRVEGATPGSTSFAFQPGEVRPGEYRFAVGSAGSATLVLQAVLPALVLASGPSHLEIEGGTHNPFAPPFDFLSRTFLPLVERMGPRVRARLRRHGFYPAGGGRLVVEIEPVPLLARLELLERGVVRRVSARALVGNLPATIGDRELRVLHRRLGLGSGFTRVETVPSAGPGNAVEVVVESEVLTEVVTAFGEKGVPAEQVAESAAAEVQEYLDAGVPVGRHLADQLLLPMALSGGGRFRTLEPTAHTRTNAEVIACFLSIAVGETRLPDGTFELEVAPAGSASRVAESRDRDDVGRGRDEDA